MSRDIVDTKSKSVVDFQVRTETMIEIVVKDQSDAIVRRPGKCEIGVLF